ncbi:hypothetical protein BJ508DRAFT_414158 [Ascobolus immersus RN42]|uniref:DUF7918 domain-containing protein n=1 Tax=Ascobolus immersus RN42 TaxID=1160509 RepID=A0A3N4IA11_ASCIM|nr:hypothetical protein BJ508DRAFT_414158 [Ascobolus immersus RN42]
MVVFEGIRFAIKTPTGILPEFPYDDEEPENTKSVYVQVPPDDEPQTFKIEYETIDVVIDPPAQKYGCSVTAHVDGVESEVSYTLNKKRYLNKVQAIDGMGYGSDDGKHFVTKSMSFTPLQRTEDASALENAIGDLAKNLGLIKLVIRQVIEETPDDDSSEYDSSDDDPVAEDDQQPAEDPDIQDIPVHEKLLKGASTSHSVRIGTSLYDDTDLEDQVACAEETKTLRIFYRSKAALQITGVIPRDPSPSPPPTAQNRTRGPLSPGDGTSRKVKRERSESPRALRERIRFLAERVERLEAERGIKRERADEGNGRISVKKEKRVCVDLEADTPSVVVKKEKKKKEVVDLTLD